MKNIFKYCALALVLITSFGCEEEGGITFSETSFVQLADARTVSITENSGQTVEVSAILGAPQGSDITVNFDVSGSAAASRYELSATSFTIPAGETSGSITFTPIDNDDIDGDVDVTLTLSSTSGLPLGIGGEGINAVSKTFSIVDDNVPCNDYTISITADRWGSEVTWEILDSAGVAVVSGGPYDDLPSGGVTTDEVAVTLADGCYTFRQYDWFGDGWGSGSAVAQCGALIAVNGDATLDGIPGLDLSTVPVNPAYGSQFNGGSDPYDGYIEEADFCVNQ